MKNLHELKNDFFNWTRRYWLKALKYAGSIFGALILIIVLIFIFFPDPVINGFIKDRITKSISEAYPAYSIKLGDFHYNIWKNRLLCDSVTLKSSDSAFTCNVESFSVRGIGWIKVFLQRQITFKTFSSTVIDAQKILFNQPKAQNEICFKTLHLSVPDSEMTADSIKYYSLIHDEQFFAKSKFRQTRFRLNIPRIKMAGLNFSELYKGDALKAGTIDLSGIFADILVNMDKPYDINSPNPQMPNEILSSIKEMIKIDTLKIINGRLKYCERYAVKSKPGVITFDKVNVSINGIATHSASPDTAIINGEGVFMNSGRMKVRMAIPLSSADFSLKYSGSLSSMNVANLNAFIEAGEHHRIKSGFIQSAAFNVSVNSGIASGTLKILYKDLSLAILDEKTGSEKGIINRILSFIGKVFVIRGSNMPDEKGSIKIGQISYVRKPSDYFLQVAWFALRSGIADLVGFPKEEIPQKK